MTSSTSNIMFGRLAASAFTRDIQAAQAFYCDVLGFSKVFENGSPVGFMILEKDGAELHLSLVKDHKPSTTNIAHLMVDNVDALHEHLVAAGVRIIKSLQDKDYGLRAFVFADPDGNRIDVGQPLKAEPSQAPCFENRRLGGVSFVNCGMVQARFDNVNLAKASFQNINLSGARFNDINMKDVSIDNANIEGLTIYGIDIHALVQPELHKPRKA